MLAHPGTVDLMLKISLESFVLSHLRDQWLGRDQQLQMGLEEIVNQLI